MSQAEQSNVVALSTQSENVIDLKAPPFYGKHALLKHQYPEGDGRWEWDSARVVLMPVVGPLTGVVNAFERMTCCNANVARFLLSRRELTVNWPQLCTVYFFGSRLVEKPWTEKVVALKLRADGYVTHLQQISDSVDGEAYAAVIVGI